MEMEIKTGNAVVEVGEVQTGRGVMVMCFKCGVVSGTVVLWYATRRTATSLGKSSAYDSQ